MKVIKTIKSYISSFKLKHPIISMLILPALLPFIFLGFPDMPSYFPVYLIFFVYFLFASYLIRSRNNKNWIYWTIIFFIGGTLNQILIVLLIIISAFEKEKKNQKKDI